MAYDLTQRPFEGLVNDMKPKICRGSGVRRKVYAGEIMCRTCYQTFVAIGSSRRETRKSVTFETPVH